MGMFDTVIIEGLKLKAPKEVLRYLKSCNSEFPREFQTKDLDNVLTTFKINEKGEVFKQDRVPTGKKLPYEPPFKSWDSERPFLEKIYWKLIQKNINKKYGKFEFVDEYKNVLKRDKTTNTIEIYSYDEVGGRYLELSYILTIVDGLVKKSILNKWEIEPENEALERKKRNDEFVRNADIQIARRKEFRSQWYYPVLREVYNPFIFFTKKIVQLICNKLITWSYRWSGV